MTYFYSLSTLSTFTLPQLKETALAQRVAVTAFPNRKSSWISAILTRQAILIPAEEIEELIIDEAPVIEEISDQAICGELNIKLVNPYPSSRIEPSGSIVAEVRQDDNYLGAIRRYYTAAGMFYAPDRRWTGVEYATAHAAALSLVDSGDVKIARASLERDSDDAFIAEFITPSQPTIPKNNFKIAPKVTHDETDEFLLRFIKQNGGQWLTVTSDGVLFGTTISAGRDSTIGEIKIDKDGRCTVEVRGGSFYERPIVTDNLESAITALKIRWIDRNYRQSHRELWAEYIGYKLDNKARPEWMLSLL